MRLSIGNARRCWPAPRAPARRAVAARRSAAPLVKACGKDGKYRHRLLAGQQRRALPPARQRRTDRGGEEGAAIHAADRRRRRQRQHADLADGQFHHPEGRSDPDLAVRGLAADAGRRAGDEGGHSGDRARPQDRRRARQGLHGLHRRRQLQDRRRKPANTSPTSCCRRAARSRCSKACRARRRRSSGSTASRTA